VGLKGSLTEKNLQKTFANESKARNKYSFFAEIARTEGYQQIGAIFEETANNEREHAKIAYRFLNGLDNTIDNLRNAINNEKAEASRIYKEYEDTARREGLPELADFFKELAEAEEHHRERFQKLLNNLLACDVLKNNVFKKDQPVRWKCRNCGYVTEGKEAPRICPLCGYPRGYYEVLSEKY